MGYYIKNLETQKIELHFEKIEYENFSDDLKKEIKSACLFSRFASAWVSRSTKNHFNVIRVAEKLKLENHGEKGEKLSFKQRIEVKQDKAANRAEKYNKYADNAEKRCEQLQSEFRTNAKDWAWLTQPNVNTSSGRAFTNQRNKIVARFEKGFEELDKSGHYKNKAAIAEATAEGAQYSNPIFVNKRIAEVEAEIRKIRRHLEPVEQQLKSGNRKKTVDGKNVIVALSAEEKEQLTSYGFKCFEQLEEAQDKLSFYNECLQTIGGVTFTREKLQEDKSIHLTYRGKIYPIKSLNSKTVTVLNWLSIAGWTWNVPYAEIQKTFSKADNKIVVCRDGKEVKPTIKLKS